MNISAQLTGNCYHLIDLEKERETTKEIQRMEE